MFQILNLKEEKKVYRMTKLESKKELYIHVGLHKTATTFLQNEIFPKLKGVKYYNLIKAKNRQEILFASMEENGKILISDEDISGTPLIFGSKAIEREKMAYALHKLFPDAKIIVGIRDKDSWFNSVKNHILRTYPYRGKKEVMENFDYEYLEFDKYINLLKKLFGENNVYVYVYEDLKANPNKFIEGICKFIGVETPYFENKIINRRISKWQLKIINMIAMLVRKCYKAYLRRMTKR